MNVFVFTKNFCRNPKIRIMLLLFSLILLTSAIGLSYESTYINKYGSVLSAGSSYSQFYELGNFSNYCGFIKNTTGLVVKLGDSLSDISWYMTTLAPQDSEQNWAIKGASTYTFNSIFAGQSDSNSQDAEFNEKYKSVYERIHNTALTDQVSYAVVMLGSNDCFLSNISGYETNLRKIVDSLISRKIVPILSTFPIKAQCKKNTSSEFNSVIIKIAHEYGLPLRRIDSEAINIDEFEFASDGVHFGLPGYNLINPITDELLSNIINACKENKNSQSEQENKNNKQEQTISEYCSDNLIDGTFEGEFKEESTSINLPEGWKSWFQDKRDGNGKCGEWNQTPINGNEDTTCRRPEWGVYKPYGEQCNEGLVTVGSQSMKMFTYGGSMNAGACVKLSSTCNSVRAGFNILVKSNNIREILPNNVPGLTSMVKAYIGFSNKSPEEIQNGGWRLVQWLQNENDPDKSSVDLLKTNGERIFLQVENRSNIINPTTLCIRVNSETPGASIDTFWDGGYASCSEDCKLLQDGEGKVECTGGVEKGGFGCCQYNKDNALKSCTIVQGPKNGTEGPKVGEINGNDAALGGVMMVPDEAIPGNWKFQWAVSQHMSYFPILYYLASSDVIGTNDHPYMTDAAFDIQRNIGDLENYFPGIKGDLDFTRQFEGIAEIDMGESVVQLPVPSLGTASAVGQISWEDYYDSLNIHCGLVKSNTEIEQVDERLICSGSSDGGCSGQKVGGPCKNISGVCEAEFLSRAGTVCTCVTDSDRAIARRKWSEFIESYNKSPKTARKNVQVEEDICLYKCEDKALIPISNCDYSDTIEIPKEDYEMTVVLSIGSYTPKQICDDMFKYDNIVGGTCIMSNGISLDDLSTAKIFYKGQYLSVENAYLAMTMDGIAPIKVTGSPFIRAGLQQSGEMRLEGMLKTLENVFELERKYSDESYSGKKICHYENIGVEIPVTKRLYDYYLPAKYAGKDTQLNFTPNITYYPKEQIFKVGNSDANYGSCEPKTEVFNSKDPHWNIATAGISDAMVAKYKDINRDASGNVVYPSTVNTIRYIYPWLGQLPQMWARMSVRNTRYRDLLLLSYTEKEVNMLLNPPKTVSEITDEYCSFIKNPSTKHLTDLMANYCYLLNDIENICYKDEIKKAKDDNLPYIPHFIKDGEPLVDCLCDTTAIDPLEIYLRKEGMLTNSFINPELPKMCEANRTNGEGDSNNNNNNNMPTGNATNLSPPYKGWFTLVQCWGATNDETWYQNCISQYPRVAPGYDGPSNMKYLKQWSESAGYAQYGEFFHFGVDLVGGKGEEIYPIGPGKIVDLCKSGGLDEDGYSLDKEECSGYGNLIVIEHTTSDGKVFYSNYGHFNTLNPDLQIGTYVDTNTLLGYEGTSGRSTGSHLHLTIFDGGPNCYKSNCKTIDPAPIFSGKGLVISGSSVNTGQNNNSNTYTPVQPQKTDSLTIAIADICRPYWAKSDAEKAASSSTYKPSLGSEDNILELIKKVAYLINSYKTTRVLPDGSKESEEFGVPWDHLAAIGYNESHLRCVPTSTAFMSSNQKTVLGNAWPGTSGVIYLYDDTCTGDPNQPTLYQDANPMDGEGKGLGQFTNGAFLRVVFIHEDAMNKCLDDLQVDRSQNQEETSDPGGAFYEGRKVYGRYLTDEEKQRMKVSFSRKRVGDSLCAMAIMLSEMTTWDTSTWRNYGYTEESQWTKLDRWISARRYNMGGNIDISSCPNDYCGRAIKRAEFFSYCNTTGLIDCSAAPPEGDNTDYLLPPAGMGFYFNKQIYSEVPQSLETILTKQNKK